MPTHVIIACILLAAFVGFYAGYHYGCAVERKKAFKDAVRLIPSGGPGGFVEGEVLIVAPLEPVTHCCTTDGSCHAGWHPGGVCHPGCPAWEGEESEDTSNDVAV